MPDRVSIRAHVERFPATMKGAFVMRAADGDPHQLRLEDARVAEVGGRARLPLGIDAAVLDVAPNLDLFIPFEFPTTELEAGWYRLECEIVIDGSPAVVHPGDRFAMPWPRAAVRKGQVTIGKRAGDVRLGDLECAADHLQIDYEATKAPRVKLSADGASHPVLDVEHEDGTSAGRILAYPALRTQDRLAIEVKGEPPIEITLP